MERFWLRSTRPHALLATALVAVLAAPLLGPAPAGAQAPPAELRVLCVEREDKVAQATSPSDCKGREQSILVPEHRPVHLCARDDFGLVRYTTDPAACTRDHEFPVTIPDSGPQILCSKNIKNGRVQERGELRWASNAAGCDSKFYTPFVTPAAPVAVDDAYTIDEDSLLTVAARGVLDNDADVAGGTLRASLVDGPEVGAVVLAPDGSFTYDPRGLFDDLDVDRSRTVRFTYTTSDDHLESEPATATITVTGRNDAPVGVDDAFVTDEDTALAVVPPGVLGNDTDAEAHQLTAHLVDTPPQGTVQMAADGGLTFQPGQDFQHLGTGDTAPVAFTYVARDGSVDSGVTRVEVTVNGVNDAPVGTDDELTTDENTPLVIAATDLLGNDTDAEGDPLALVDLGAGNPPTTFTDNGDGTIGFDPRSAYDHLQDGQTAVATITYRASDGTATSAITTLRITVTGISPAVANHDVARTDEDTPVAIDVLGNDVVAGGTLELGSLVSGGTVGWDGTVVTYDPNGTLDHLAPGEEVVVTFRYHLVNAEGASAPATVQVTVEGRNDAPVARDQARTVVVGGVNRYDDTFSLLYCPPGSSPCPQDVDTPVADLHVVLVSPPEKGRLVLLDGGAYEFDPAGEMAEEDEVAFRYRLSDGDLESATAEVSLRSGGPNIPPELMGPTRFTIIDDDDPQSVALAIDAQDPDGDNDAIRFALDPESTRFRIDPTTGVISLSAGMPPLGTHTLTVRITDAAGASVTGTVRVTVAVRFQPTDDVYRAVVNTRLLAGGAAPDPAEVAVTAPDGVLANDGAPGDLEVHAPGTQRTSLGGRVDVQPDGRFTYTPPRPDRDGIEDACDPMPHPTDGTPTWDGTLPATDTFTYQVRTASDVSSVQTRTVHLELAGIVWIVDPSATDIGCGTGRAPYASPASVSTRGDEDGPGDTVYLRSGVHPSGIVLEDGQHLLGEGVPLVVGEVPLLAGAPTLAPVVQPPAGASVRLAEDNVLRGFSVDALGSGIDHCPAPSPADPATECELGDDGLERVGSAVIDLPSVRAAGGPALDLVDGDVDVDIAVLAAGNAHRAMALDRVGGAVDLAEVTTSEAALVASSPAAVTVGQLTTSDAGGLRVVDGPGIVAVATLASTATGTALDVAEQQPTGQVVVAALTATGGSDAVVVDGGAGVVDVGQATVTDPAGAALRVDGHRGTVRIDDGTLTASSGPAGAMVDVTGVDAADAGGTVHVGADITNPDGTGSAGRPLRVDGLRGGSVTVAGAVGWDGAGVRITDSAGGAVGFTGGVDVTTMNGTPLYATDAVLTMTGPGNRLVADGRAALRLSGVVIGAAGARIAEASSSGATYLPGVLEQEGYGVYLSAVSGTGGGRLVIGGGTITTPAVGGVFVQSSFDQTVGALRITEAGTDDAEGVAGVHVRGGRGILLDGTVVERPRQVGVLGADTQDLTLRGVSVDDSDGVGIQLDRPMGTLTRLDGTAVGDSRATGLLVTGAASGSTALAIINSTVSGTPAEVDGIRIDTVAGTDLDLTMGGDIASASVGGRHSLVVDVVAGATVDVDLSRSNIGHSARDAVLLTADGHDDDGNPLPTTLDVDVIDLDATTGGGIVSAGEVGLHVVSRNGATVRGSIVRAAVRGAGTAGILIDRAHPFALDQVTVNGGGEAGVAVRNTQDVTMDRLQVEGAPSVAGVELWGTRDVTIRRSRVDLRALPDPQEPPDSAPWYEQHRDLDSVHETCTTSGNAVGIFFPRRDPLIVEGTAGILARHTAGVLAIEDSTVRGATLHQLVVFNGSPPPGTTDPVGRPTPLHGQGSASGAVLRTQGLILLDSQEDRTGLFAGAGANGDLSIELGPQPTDSVVAQLFCATDGGRVNVDGSPHLLVTLAQPGLVLKSAGSTSRLDFDLNGITIEYSPEVEDLPEFLRPFFSALWIISESGGRIQGSISNATVINAPGDAVTLADDTVINGLSIVDAAGTGLTIDGLTNVEVNQLQVTDPTGDGVRIVDADQIRLAGVTITDPGGAGAIVQNSTTVSLTDATITGPQTHAVQAETVSGLVLRGADLHGSSATDATASGIHARNVVPLTADDVTVTGFDSTPVDLLNGTSYPGAGPMPDLPCDTATCSGTIQLSALDISDTPAGGSAVDVRNGQAVLATVRLGGASVLDGPLAVTAADTSTFLMDDIAPAALRFTGNGDGLVIGHATSAGEVQTSLSQLEITMTGASGRGLVVDGTGPWPVQLQALGVSGGQTGIDLFGTAVDLQGGNVTGTTGTAVVLRESGGSLIGLALDDVGGDGVSVVDGRQVDLTSLTATDVVGTGVHVADTLGIAVRDATMTRVGAGVWIDNVEFAGVEDTVVLDAMGIPLQLLRADDVSLLRNVVDIAAGDPTTPPGIVVDDDGTGGCAVIAENDASGYPLSFVLHTGLDDLRPFETVQDHLTRRNNQFATVDGSSSVHPC